MLSPELLAKLKAEIAADPDKLYAGKSPAQIADLLAQPIKTPILYVTPAVKPAPKDGDVIGEAIKDPPVFRVINGVPEAPNVFSAQDISDALASKGAVAVAPEVVAS